MKTTLLSKAMTMISLPLLATVLRGQASDPLDTPHLQPSDSAAAATPHIPGVSKVRIVRLSQVKGAVEIDRNIGRGFEPGIANLPVVEGSRIRTGVGVAEVEFEDNSSLRLAPDTTVNFPVLERSATGATLNEVRVEKGSAYISLVKPQSKNAPVDQFVLRFGLRKVNLDPATHVRVDVAVPNAKLAVLDGAVKVDGENGPLDVSKKRTATFALMEENQQPSIAKDIEKMPFDEWDHSEASYHANRATFSAFNSPYAYGLNDMMYYGAFMNAGGCGSMWRPYFASASWDPYANGTWAWYGGGGYSWVSPYPWAWTPYHYGSWSYCPNVGWGWMPGVGGGWYGINNVAMIPTVAPNNGGTALNGPRMPSHPPLPHAPAMVAVSTKPLMHSEIASSTSSFLFRKDSAGMGVPRGTLGNLQKFSRETLTHGTAQMPVYASVPQMNRAGGANSTNLMAGSIHRGYAPAPSSGMSERGYSGPNSYGGMNSPSGGVRSGGPAPAPTASSPSAASSPSVHR